MKKVLKWLDDRTGFTEMINPLLDHPVPRDAKWAYVFGSATLFAFILQVVTGVALAFLYQPTTANAYDSLKYINEQAKLGHLLRGMHFFGSSAMILLVGIHMIRVYLYAAFKFPREMSWISGVFLLLLTVAMGFTGQLLRWDSNGVWSAIVGAEQIRRIPLAGKYLAEVFLGGDIISDATLSRFFSFHVFLIPAIIFLLIGLHIYIVLRNGISEPPKPGQRVDKNYREWYKKMLDETGVPFWPYAAWRDAIFGIIVIFTIFLLGFIFGGPEIGPPPDPTNIIAYPKPDWYLLWIFALFALMPRGIEEFFLMFGPIIVGIILLAVPFIANKGERHYFRRPWSIAIVAATVTIIIAFWRAGQLSPWSPNFDTKPLSQEIVASSNDTIKKGASLMFTKSCLNCHTVSGTGGKRGPDLTFAGSRLNKNEITIRIVNGENNMPAYGSTISNTDLNSLVEFVASRKRK